jgi:hypothetical protein
MNYFELVLLVGRKVPKCQSSLALDFWRGRLGQVHQVLYESGFGLGQLPSVGGVDSNIAQGGRAIILHVNVGGRQQLHQHWDGAGIYQLLPVFICNLLAACCKLQAAKRIESTCLSVSC